MSDQVAELAQRYLELAVNVTVVARGNAAKIDTLASAVTAHDSKLDTLIEELRGLRHALDARTALVARAVDVFKTRWPMFLLGLSGGLGLAGARVVVGVLLEASGVGVGADVGDVE
jgi:outer membrane murein-binding lipoprotein Lpp